jgi:hypothetical protein
MAVEFSGKEKLRWKMPVLCGGGKKGPGNVDKKAE